MGLGLAIKVFFKTLAGGSFAGQVQDVLAGQTVTPALESPQQPSSPEAEAESPRRSEALTMLAVLQREGRLVDFLTEPIDGYTDAQIGAAVREVHRDCAAALDRIFQIKPLSDVDEDQMTEVPAGFSAMRTRLVGQVEGDPPYRGAVRHRGWVAEACRLPSWQGDPADAMVIAPVEVEVGH